MRQVNTAPILKPNSKKQNLVAEVSLSLDLLFQKKTRAKTLTSLLEEDLTRLQKYGRNICYWIIHLAAFKTTK